MINNCMPLKGESPYSTKFASPDIDHEMTTGSKLKSFKRDERETHTAPNTLPYEMGNLPKYYGDMIDAGIQACKDIENVLKVKDVENKKDLLKLKRATEKMVLWLLQNVDFILEKYTIGETHAADDKKEEKMEEEVYD